MGYNGRWIDSFNVSIVEEKDIPNMKGKIRLETPDIIYIFNREQWSEFKQKVNKV